MSKSIDEVTLLELLPENLRSDLDIIAASQAIDQEFSLLVQSINNCFTFVDIDNANSEVVNLLAAEMHVDFYDESLPLESRRAIVKNAYIYHFTKGTPFAVKQLIIDIFGQGELIEWFDYEGNPYHFRVAIDYAAVSEFNIQKFIKLIDSVKNMRSKLESIEYTIRTFLGIQEEIYSTNIVRNTKLGVWTLGNTTFATPDEEVKRK